MSLKVSYELLSEQFAATNWKEETLKPDSEDIKKKFRGHPKIQKQFSVVLMLLGWVRMKM